MNEYYNQNPYAGQFYGYNNQAPQGMMPRVKNLLTNEEINMLRQKVEQFNLSLTQEEILKGKCTHRDQNGLMSLTQLPDGTKRCTICGEIINDKDYSEDEVAKTVDETINIINMIKLFYGELPPQAAADFYMIQPLLKKLPKLMKIATSNSIKYDSINQMNQYNNPNTLNAYNAIMAGPGMPMGPSYGYPQQNYFDPNVGMMGAAPQQMAGYQQPMAPVDPSQNPFYASGYQQTPMNPAYQPQAQGFAYQPGMAQAQPTPQQVVAPQPTATAQPSEVQVNTTLKA